MNKPNVRKFLKSTANVLSARSPEILTSIGITGMVTMTFLAVKATPKALKKVEAKKQEEGVDALTVKDTIKATWKCYVPAAATGAVSIACIVGASTVHVKRNAALAAAYKISETALTEYRDAVVETIGEKKEVSVRDTLAKKHIAENPVSESTVIVTEKGNTLCYDAFSGRYFKSDIDHIKRAVNEINRRMLLEMYVSLNDLYDEIGLPSIELGDELGWNIDTKLIEPYFGSHIADESSSYAGTPCLVIEFNNPPKYGYSKLA